MQEDGWLQGKVGGQWRSGHQGKNEETGRERREKVDRKDDRELEVTSRVQKYCDGREC